jgi:predicted flavoprotein YhiN
MNPALDVVILEKTKKLLSKVRISGGGRCNVTHACFDVDEIIKKLSEGKQFVKKSFHQFFTRDTIRWFRRKRCEAEIQKTTGEFFPTTNSSQTIIDVLLREANRYNVTIQPKFEVRNIDVKYANDGGRRAYFLFLVRMVKFCKRTTCALRRPVIQSPRCLDG